MRVINARNVNVAFMEGIRLLRGFHQEEESRNGPVWVCPTPVTTVYSRPQERVLFSEERNANPFFHVLEALWMLAGRNDVAFPHSYAPMMLYSDDSETLNGAYGFRWREHFGYDQLAIIIEELRNNPSTRRCVLAMWDATDKYDLGNHNEPQEGGDLKFGIAGGKDIPCNTHVYFRVNQSELDMTVCNRSNDIVWGAYGANAVHFSVLQEYVAAMAGLRVGTYYQVSNNFHAYIDRTDSWLVKNGRNLLDDRYNWSPSGKLAQVHELVTATDWFDKELAEFMAEPAHPGKYRNRFFHIAADMAAAHAWYKEGDLPAAIELLRYAEWDWYIAGREWMQRIQAKRLAKEQGL